MDALSSRCCRSPFFAATLLSHFIAAPLRLPSSPPLHALQHHSSLCRSMPFGFSLCGIAPGSLPLLSSLLRLGSFFAFFARALRSCEGINRQCVCMWMCTVMLNGLWISFDACELTRSTCAIGFLCLICTLGPRSAGAPDLRSSVSYTPQVPVLSACVVG